MLSKNSFINFTFITKLVVALIRKKRDKMIVTNKMISAETEKGH